MNQQKKISILHISDLHKNDGDDFKNLFQKMVEDCDRYVKQGIEKPNIIVVSGDLIRGGQPDEIRRQYVEAKDFLEDLTDFFLTKDKSRIVIVPGNHDVDWNVTKGLMTPLPNDTEEEKKYYKKTLELYLRERAPKVRWSWDDQQLYYFKDGEAYNTRFHLFSEFFKSFYGNKDFPLVPGEQAKIFDIPEYNISFVGFNSCYQNDHLNKVGQILPICVTKASTKIKELREQGRILVAVWHHNATGRPMVNNYLDNRILNPIIDMGIHIALHGHQHFSGVLEEYHNAFKEGKLLMYSTGSLYGATETLSYGAPRQYNILEIEKVGKELKLTVHLRQDNNSEEYGIPSWGEGIIKDIGTSYWSTRLPYPKEPLDMDALSKLINKGMESGDYGEAIQFLRDAAQEDNVSRKMMLDLMMKGTQYREVIDYIDDPKTDEDALLILDAAFKLNDSEISKKVRDYEGIKASKNAQVRKMKDYL